MIIFFESSICLSLELISVQFPPMNQDIMCYTYKNSESSVCCHWSVQFVSAEIRSFIFCNPEYVLNNIFMCWETYFAEKFRSPSLFTLRFRYHHAIEVQVANVSSCCYSAKYSFLQVDFSPDSFGKTRIFFSFYTTLTSIAQALWSAKKYFSFPNVSSPSSGAFFNVTRRK